jgi:hypothetical protein
LNSNSNRATYKESFGWFVFLVLDLFTLKAHNFLISNLFQTIVSVSDVPRGGVQILLDPRSKRALPLDPACLESLNDQSPASLPYLHHENGKKTLI